MPKILTPVSLWNNFDVSLELNPQKDFEGVYSDVKVELVYFDGRDTGDGRVKIAAAFAYNDETADCGTVLILPDSKETIDIEVLKMFVKRGYRALMVDYRGEWEGCNFHTVYPENVFYGNVARCGRYKDYVDDSAVQTSWYEWACIGLYAARYIRERTGLDSIGVVGIRDGGEIAWKIGVADKFACIIPVSAAGWKAYTGISKYEQEEMPLNEERYRFIAGIDSQAYAPYVNCPVLMLCSTNDTEFDYDRAYDTFSRINSKYSAESAIAYSIRNSASIGEKCIEDMFLFLDKNIKNREVFIPKPADVVVEVDEDSNLVARAIVDERGVVKTCRVFLAEDCQNSAFRELNNCPVKDEKERLYYLNIYEKTATIYVLCRVRYLNGFTVWSKVAIKKISGKFRNMRKKSQVIFSDDKGISAFSIAEPYKCSVGGIFITNDKILPHIVAKAKGVKGLYSECGLSTLRMSNPQFTASATSLLSIDLYCDENTTITLTFSDLTTGESYVNNITVVGGVWQSAVLESKTFKSAGGVPLGSFVGEMKLTVSCPTGYAINNLMWL
ncbi:MAG: hypothetical protein K2K80_04780 [Clostridia bacterium]|nr:hypothetical protein [Clostridia bacterium]